MFDFEMDLMRFLQNLRTDFLNNLFECITMLGEETLLIVLVAIIYFAIDKHLAYRLFFVTASSAGTNSIIKNIVKMPRPFATGEITCVRPDTATGYSFPSGHTQTFATWSPVLAMRLKKRWLNIIVGIAIFLVALSRVFLGAHYPSDVLVGMMIGIFFAFAGNYLYDKVEDKQKLYIGLVVFFTPFAVFFLFSADPLYGDLYKFYGMITGVVLAMSLESKYAPLDYNVALWKKVLRVVIGVVLAFAVKEGIKALNVFNSVYITFGIDTLRYFILVVAVFGWCPILFKKCKL